ncbi:serine hydrolase domain-containing protein [Kitasatospora sp. MAP5-34]|uniref:serine hydrolase domain-containing protein n=1 Tax=Kitasatospora sp. MAP5-34 TaxID=3035102 RepID=UPI00247B7F41|nr:hypothetical protein [Kitasatospora sp. MAP5-34]
MSTGGSAGGSVGGLSRTRLARMHDIMTAHVERGELPGLVTLVSRHGEVYVDAIGSLAVDGAEPMRRDTVFRIASMTKPVTAAAAMMLVEECRLRAGRAGRPAAARVGRPQGAHPAGQAPRRHRPCPALDHPA